MATVYLAGQYATDGGRGDGSVECNEAIEAIRALDDELDVETIISAPSRPSDFFSDRNVHRVQEAYCQTLEDSDAESLEAYKNDNLLIPQHAEDGRTVHLGPLTFERGSKVLVKAGSHYRRMELSEELATMEGLEDIFFEPVHPNRDEFVLGALQTVIMHAMQYKKVDGEIFVFALSGSAHFAFWASTLDEAFAVWKRAAGDMGQLTTPSRSRLFSRHKNTRLDYHPSRANFGADIAADIRTVRCQPWGADEERGAAI